MVVLISDKWTLDQMFIHGEVDVFSFKEYLSHFTVLSYAGLLFFHFNKLTNYSKETMEKSRDCYARNERPREPAYCVEGYKGVTHFSFEGVSKSPVSIATPSVEVVLTNMAMPGISWVQLQVYKMSSRDENLDISLEQMSTNHWTPVQSSLPPFGGKTYVLLVKGTPPVRASLLLTSSQTSLKVQNQVQDHKLPDLGDFEWRSPGDGFPRGQYGLLAPVRLRPQDLPLLNQYRSNGTDRNYLNTVPFYLRPFIPAYLRASLPEKLDPVTRLYNYTVETDKPPYFSLLEGIVEQKITVHFTDSFENYVYSVQGQPYSLTVMNNEEGTRKAQDWVHISWWEVNPNNRLGEFLTRSNASDDVLEYENQKYVIFWDRTAVSVQIGCVERNCALNVTSNTSTLKSWVQAQALCKSWNGTLPVFRSRDEVDEAMVSVATSRNLPKISGLFVGLIYKDHKLVKNPKQKYFQIKQTGYICAQQFLTLPFCCFAVLDKQRSSCFSRCKWTFTDTKFHIRENNSLLRRSSS